MQDKLQIRYNVMKINTISGFSRMKGGFHNGCRDIYFLAFNGVNETYKDDIIAMDQRLGMQMSNGNGYYKRIPNLPSVMPESEVIFYKKSYEAWVASGRKEMAIKICRNPYPQMKEKVSRLCEWGETLYKANTENASDSMIKNFIVKLLYWIDYIFEDKNFNMDEKHSSKIVVHNVKKKQELLCWYLVTKLGNDVLLLQYENDLMGCSFDPDIQKNVLGDFQSVALPIYEKPVLAESRAGSGKQEESEHKMIKVIIPQRKGRHTDNVHDAVLPDLSQINDGEKRNDNL